MKDSARRSWLDAGGRAEEFEEEVAFSQDGDAQAPHPRGRDERAHSTEAKRRQQLLDIFSRRECPGREVGGALTIVLTYSRRATFSERL